MGALFGKSKKTVSRVTEHDKAVLQLKQQRDKLKQYVKRIELSLEKDRQLAKQCLNSGRKDRARMLLRKKKYQEKLLVTTDQQLENLEKMTSDLEFAQIEQKVLDGLKTGNAALKEIHQILTVEEIERVLDETQEGIEKQREIDMILNHAGKAALTDEDEEDVLAELDDLVRAERGEEPAKPEKDVVLPDVPDDEMAADTEQEPDERAKPAKQKRRTEERVALEA